MKFVIHVKQPDDDEPEGLVLFYEESKLLKRLISEWSQDYCELRDTACEDPSLPAEEGLWVWLGTLNVVDHEDVNTDNYSVEDNEIGYHGDQSYFKNGFFRRLTDLEAINFAHYNDPWKKQSGVDRAAEAAVKEILRCTTPFENDEAQKERPQGDSEHGQVNGPRDLSTTDLFNSMIKNKND